MIEFTSHSLRFAVEVQHANDSQEVASSVEALLATMDRITIGRLHAEMRENADEVGPLERRIIDAIDRRLAGGVAEATLVAL